LPNSDKFETVSFIIGTKYLFIINEQLTEIKWIKFCSIIQFLCLTQKSENNHVMLKFRDNSQFIFKAKIPEETELIISALQTVIINCRFQYLDIIKCSTISLEDINAAKSVNMKILQKMLKHIARRFKFKEPKENLFYDNVIHILINNANAVFREKIRENNDDIIGANDDCQIIYGVAVISDSKFVVLNFEKEVITNIELKSLTHIVMVEKSSFITIMTPFKMFILVSKGTKGLYTALSKRCKEKGMAVKSIIIKHNDPVYFKNRVLDITMIWKVY